MKPFDNYEISPCRRFEEPNRPGRFYFEVCEPKEADVWTLYGHVNGEGVQAIGDFTSRDHAEETFFRITGMKFTGSYKVEAHLRVMHATEPLLDALHSIAGHSREFAALEDPETMICRIEAKARAVILEATGRAA